MNDNEHLIKQAEARTEKAELRAEQAESREREMRASELSYRRLFEAARDGILILNVKTGRIDDVNPFLVELLGFSHDEMVGKTVGELSPFRDILSNQTMLERLQKDGYIRYEDLPLQTKDGRHIEVEFVSNVYQAGDVKVIQCNIRDVSERKKAAAALHESERFSQATLDALNAQITVLDEKGNIIAINKAWREFALANTADMKAISEGINYLSVCEQAAAEGDQDALLTAKAMREIMAGVRKSWTHEYPCHTANEKQWFVCRITRFPGDGPVRLVVAHNDITERKLSEYALRESEEKFRSIFNAAATSIAISTPHGHFLQVNAAYCQMLGYTEDELLKQNFASLTHPEDLKLNLKLRDEMLAGQRESFVMEKRYLKKNGDIVWTRHSVAAVRTPNGEVSKMIVVAEDVTERKRTEARFRRLVDSNAQGVIFWNTKGQITQANDSFLKLVGYTRADLEAGPIDWVALTPPEYADLDQFALKEIAATGVCTPFEKEYIRKDGSRVPILIGAASFEDNPHEGVCFVLDLTERKKLENQFRQTQKMESIGTLAGGVAHDFNNILAVIQIQAELLKTSGRLSAEQTKFADEIGATVQRAAALTRQLLLFSRKEALQTRDLDLSQSIHSLAKMLQRILGEDIEVQFKFSAQPLFIHADAGMIDQVLMNLAVNSRDAMPKGGRLIIETSAVDFDENVSAQSAQARPGEFVCLSVSDSGCGIPPENLARIFEPFFTTKEVGKGTGLGLATIFGIVQQHRGWVNVYSEVGHGTTFRIYLPRLTKLSLFPQKPKRLGLANLPGGTETILFVEDDNFLRPSVCQTLTGLGYHVLETSNGNEALTIWKQHRDKIHLLLTDMVMPGGITGKDLGERLLQEKPKLKVIYASGYAAEVAGKDFPLKEGVNFLTKPFQTQKLAQTIRASLDKSI